jgi:hypothetical protein
MPAKVFLSYRRKDTALEANRLHSQLTALLRPEGYQCNPVFLDELVIESGRDFRKALRFELKSCKIVLVLMGDTWLKLLQDGLKSPDQDYVRYEIRTALRPNGLRRVVPVLFGRAVIPQKEELPRDIRRLVHLQALDCRDPEELSSGRLAQRVQRLLAEQEIPFEQFQEHLRIPEDVEKDYIVRIDDRLSRAVGAMNPAARRNSLSQSLALACHYIRLRDIGDLAEALRDYPTEQNEVVETFLGDRMRFNHFLRLVKSAVRQLGTSGERFLNDISNLQKKLRLFLFRRNWVDEFSDAWSSLERMVCNRAAHFERVANLSDSGAALCCCLVGAYIMNRSVRRETMAPASPLRVGPQIIGGTVVQAVHKLSEMLGSNLE